MLYVIQLAIVMAVWFANIHYGWMENPYNIGATAVFVAMAVTVSPLKVMDWWRFREARKAEHAELAAKGLPFGWRRHLPGADARAARRRRATQQTSRDILPQ